MSMKLCKICLSPYRKEIESLKSNGVSYPRLFRKYAPLMNYDATEKSFVQMLYRHFKQLHRTDAILNVTPPGSALPVKRVTLENYTKRMLQLGIEKADSSTPDSVSFKDVNSAVKLSLDAAKIKIAENALEMQMNKMFGPEIDPDKVIDGREDGLRTIG